MRNAAQIRMAIFAGLLSFTMGACGSKKEESEPAKAEATKPAEAAKPEAAKPEAAKPEVAKMDPEAAKAEAKSVFEGRCVACHGASGKGDGPGAAAINPKPRDYTNAEWQASVADEDIAKTIVKGGLAVGKSAVMPGNPDLRDKPEVVKELVNIIRDFEE